MRVPVDLKKTLLDIASKEGRSLAQVCEAFLRGGATCYEKEGSKYIQRFLAKKR